MTASKDPSDTARAFEDVLDTYNEVLRDCYHALEAGAPQEKRDALRTAIRGFVDKQRARHARQDQTKGRIKRKGDLDGNGQTD